MKILYIITGLRLGGAERVLLSTCLQIRKDYSAEIALIYFDPYAPLLPKFTEIGIQTHLMEQNGLLLPRLVQFIHRGHFDVIHTHLIHADLIGRLAAFMASCGRESVVFSTTHGVEWFRWRKTPFSFLVRTIDRLLVLPNKSYIIAISKSVRDALVKNQGIPPEKIHLLYNALEIPPSSRLVRTEERGEVLRLLFIGRLAPEKNIPCLLRALALTKNLPITLTIVGEGKSMDELQQWVLRLDLADRVSLPGPTLEPERYYKTHDVFILPSSSEGLGNVILEAFCHRLAVIGSEVEGIRELLEGGRGLLFPNNDYDKLATQIKLLYHNRDLASALGEAGFHYVKEHHDICDYVRQLLQLYQLSAMGRLTTFAPNER